MLISGQFGIYHIMFNVKFEEAHPRSVPRWNFTPERSHLSITIVYCIHPYAVYYILCTHGEYENNKAIKIDEGSMSSLHLGLLSQSAVCIKHILICDFFGSSWRRDNILCYQPEIPSVTDTHKHTPDVVV